MSDTPPIAAPSGFQVRLFRSFDEPDIGAARWNDLVARSDTATVFQTYEWMTSWWNSFGAGHELLLIAVFRDARLAGLASMMRKLKEDAAPEIAFVSDGNADYCDFLLAEPRLTVLQLIIAALAAQCGRRGALRLNNIPEHSFTARHLYAVCTDNHLLPLVCARLECPAMVFGEPGRQAREIRKRHSLKRPYRHFRSQGTLGFTELASREQALAKLPAFFEQHVSRWRDSASPSLFNDPRNREFYRELVSRMLPTGWLVFSCLTLGERPLAFHLGFDYGRRYYWYKPSFDIELRKHSPGNLLLRFLLLRALERQCDEFDFTIGNEAFKHRYSNTTRHNLYLMIYTKRRAYMRKRAILFARTQLKRLAFWRR